MSESSEPKISSTQPRTSATDPSTAAERKTHRLPPYNVVIFNDEDHSFPYVIDLLVKLFRHPKSTAELLTWRIHMRGRAVVYTTHKEKAEFKREQVLSYGADPLVASSKGPLRCVIEPANSD